MNGIPCLNKDDDDDDENFAFKKTVFCDPRVCRNK